MDFDRLQEFLVIAEAGSIKKAAQTLGISAATLSSRLLRFEEHLGMLLFERSSAALTLTPAGVHLLPVASEICRTYSRITQQVLAAREHTYHRLRIAVTGTNLPIHLGPFLDRLNANYPDMQLELLDDSQYGIIDGLMSGQVDIYFAPVMQDFAPPELSKNTVSTASHYVILPRGHRLAEGSMVPIRELSGEQFILYPATAEPAIRDFQLRNLQAAGIDYTVYDGETPPIFYKLLIPVGKGILLRPTPGMMDLPPNAVALPVTGLKHPAPMCFFYRKDTSNLDTLAFAQDFPAFARKEIPHEHHKAL